MKATKYILSLVIAMTGLTSCEDFLDVNPDGQVKQEELLSTTDGIESAMYGVYAQLRNESLYGSALSFKYIDVMAQHFNCSGNDLITAIGNYEYSNTNVKNVFEGIWTQMYNNISNVNAVIGCDLVKDAETYPYKIYRGEALGLRAFMHFDLMRLFTEQITLNQSASGIPYATEFSLKTPEFKSAQEVYQLILTDLLDAERLLSDEADYEGESEYMLDRKIHFNLHAVRATLARVYLTIGDKDKAAQYALKVIDESDCKLTDKIDVDGDLAGVMSVNETIFGVYYAGFYSVVNPSLQQRTSFSSLDPRRDYEEIYSKNLDGVDFRLDAYFEIIRESPRFIKLTDVYELQGMSSSRPSEKILGINMIRLPEMYYIMAEALLESDKAQATRYFNDVLEHRGLTAIDQRPVPLNLSMELINDERYKELWGEGQNFYNLKRQNTPISLVGGDVVEPSNKVYVVPIPDIEYDYRN